MYKKILVPVDLADTDLAKPAIDTAVEMAAAPADRCGWSMSWR